MGVKSIPSRMVYSVDVPEVSDVDAKFVYNYYVYNESVRDKDILNDDAIKNMHLSQNIISKPRSEIAESYLDYGEKKFPRYVKITFKKPPKVQSATGINNNDLIRRNFDKIVSEENFATDYYTSVNFKNANIDKQSSSIFENSSMLLKEDSKKYNDRSKNKNINRRSSSASGSSVESYVSVKNRTGSSNPDILGEAMSQLEYSKNVLFKKGDGTKATNDFLQTLKKVSSNTQISNNLFYSLVQSAAQNPFSQNNESFKQIAPYAKLKVRTNNNHDVTDDEFKTSIQYYKVVSSADDASSPTKSYLVGYVIDKIELFPDGTKKVHNPIIIENPNATSYVDFDIRYGTTYVYYVKSVVEITFAAVDNDSSDVSMISSLVCSKPMIAYTETTENIPPPPPIELKFVWDYDRINPTTAQIDSISNKPFPNTGVRGSLMLYWSFPINTQMDIKKFQIFRRSSVEDPFEIIKVYDFNDAIVKFPDSETNIDQKVVETVTPHPQLYFYDDDFHKNTEYIYCVACVDAHGISSNYSEQFNVKFELFSNKIKTQLVSIANSPKNYPNLYIQRDLFMDSIKTSNKNEMSIYFTPDCYQVKNKRVITNVLGTSNRRVSYKLNFINIENQNSTNLSIRIKDIRNPKQKLRAISSRIKKNLR